MLTALKDEDEFVRYCAERALGVIGEPAVGLLATLLSDENFEVRERAVRLLGEIKDESAIEPLIGLLRTEEDELIKSVTAASLAGITGEYLGSNAEEWESWKLEN